MQVCAHGIGLQLLVRAGNENKRLIIWHNWGVKTVETKKNVSNLYKFETKNLVVIQSMSPVGNFTLSFHPSPVQCEHYIWCVEIQCNPDNITFLKNIDLANLNGVAYEYNNGGKRLEYHLEKWQLMNLTGHVLLLYYNWIPD